MVRIGFNAQMSFTFSNTRGQTEIVGQLVMNKKDRVAASSVINSGTAWS